MATIVWGSTPTWRRRIERLIDALLSHDAGAVWQTHRWNDAAYRQQTVDQLARFLELVVKWNAAIDLTAARSEDELVDLFVADALVLSLSAAALGSEQWVDVGSGAGAPGLVLKLVRPQLSLTLVEPRAKRVSFLRSAVGSLGLRQVEVAPIRSDAVSDKCCDVAVSRATFSPEIWLPEGARLARHAVWVLLARGEIPATPGWEVTHEVGYQWPLTSVERRAIRLSPV